MKAFPSGTVIDHNGLNNPLNDGMDLRDYFAAKALPTVVKEYGSNSFNDIAVISYQIADAMMKAREQ